MEALIDEAKNLSWTELKAVNADDEALSGYGLTDEQAAAVRKYLAMGIPKTVVAKLVGLTRGRLLRWLEQERKG